MPNIAQYNREGRREPTKGKERQKERRRDTLLSSRYFTALLSPSTPHLSLQLRMCEPQTARAVVNLVRLTLLWLTIRLLNHLV